MKRRWPVWGVAVLWCGVIPARAQSQGIEWVSEFNINAGAFETAASQHLRHGPADTGWQGYEQRYVASIDAHRSARHAHSRNLVLWECTAGILSARLGNWRDAQARLQWAADVMDNRIELAGDEARRTQAAWGQERTKTWRGEPYERAMANFYVGLAAYKGGDFDTAAVAFRRALDADSISQEHYQDDFRLAHYFLAKALYRRDGAGASDIDVALQKAARYVAHRASTPPPAATFAGARRTGSGDKQRTVEQARARKRDGELYTLASSYLTRHTIEEANLTLVLGLGRAPAKMIAGLQGESDRLVPTAQLVHTVDVAIDGTPQGRAYPMVNLHHQALTRGRSQKDTTQVGKAVAKTAGYLALALFSTDAANAFNQAWDIYGDTRTWYLLPNEVHVYSGRVSPGLHTIKLGALDADGNPLPRHDQLWNAVPVPWSGEQVLYLSMLPDRTNVSQQRVLMPVSRYNRRRQEVRFDTSALASAGKAVHVGDQVSVVSFAAERDRENRYVRTAAVTRTLPARVVAVDRRAGQAKLDVAPDAKVGRGDYVVLPFDSVTHPIRVATPPIRVAAPPQMPKPDQTPVASQTPVHAEAPASIVGQPSEQSEQPQPAIEDEVALSMRDEIETVAVSPIPSTPSATQAPAEPQAPAMPAPSPVQGEVPEIQVQNVSLADVHMALARAGYGAAAEWGSYGPMTTRNVKRFQRDRDLRPTGVIDPPTWRALKAYHR